MRDVTMEAEVRESSEGVCCWSAHRRRGHEPRNMGGLSKLEKGMETDFPLEPPEGTQAC